MDAIQWAHQNQVQAAQGLCTALAVLALHLALHPVRHLHPSAPHLILLQDMALQDMVFRRITLHIPLQGCLQGIP